MDLDEDIDFLCSWWWKSFCIPAFGWRVCTIKTSADKRYLTGCSKWLVTWLQLIGGTHYNDSPWWSLLNPIRHIWATTLPFRDWLGLFSAWFGRLDSWSCYRWREERSLSACLDDFVEGADQFPEVVDSWWGFLCIYKMPPRPTTSIRHAKDAV